MSVRPNKGIPVDRTYPGVIAMQPNSIVPFAVDCNSLLEELGIKLTGTLTLAGWSGAPTIRAEGLENLISSVRFTGNGKANGSPTVAFSDVDAAFLRLKTLMFSGAAPVRVNVGNGNAAYNFETDFSKYFGVKRLAGLHDATFLDTRNLQQLTMNLQFRDINALVKPGTGAGGGTAVLSDVEAIVHSVEWQGGAASSGQPYVKETMRPFDLTNYSGLNKDFLNMPIGNFVLRQYFKGTVGDVDYADPSDAFFATTALPEGSHVKTIITGSGGTRTLFDTVYPVLQTNDTKRYGITPWPTGYAVVEYSRTGTAKNLLNLTPASILSAKNQVDITTVAEETNTLHIYDEELVTT